MQEAFFVWQIKHYFIAAGEQVNYYKKINP